MLEEHSHLHSFHQEAAASQSHISMQPSRTPNQVVCTVA
jgi:hypothetical protein